jgi:hypothetical protein
MTREDLIGKKLIEVYETVPSSEEGMFDTKAQYFQIILKLEDNTLIELGVHQLKDWTSNEALRKIEGTSWALENGLDYKNKTIKEIIERDPDEFFDGSLTLVLENDVILEHLSTNGDQLFIGTVDELREENKKE